MINKRKTPITDVIDTIIYNFTVKHNRKPDFIFLGQNTFAIFRSELLSEWDDVSQVSIREFKYKGIEVILVNRDSFTWVG